MNIKNKLIYLDELKNSCGYCQFYFREFDRIADEINNNPYRLIYENGKHNYRKYTFEELAICYAEKYGIIEYHIKGGTMIYYNSYEFEHCTMKIKVNLITQKEISRTQLKGFYKSYKSKIGGKYTANYYG